MTATAPARISVGYEGRELDTFVDDLVAQRVQVLVDVRLNPISRKRGFSKTRLTEALWAAGTGLKHLVDIVVAGDDDEPLTATDGHPFWIEGRGWIDANNLRPGDRLLQADGGLAPVESVRLYDVSDATVHNLTVAGLHTYYVLADEPVLVHNISGSCPIGSFREIERPLGDGDLRAIGPILDAKQGWQAPWERS